MSLADEIEKLDELHRRGALSNEEYALAKQKVLGAPIRVEEDLAQLKREGELNRLDREWAMTRAEYLSRSESDYGQPPSRFGSIGFGVSIIGFGICWLIMSSSMESSFSKGMSGARAIVPVVCILVGIGAGVYGYMRAGEYETLKALYERRRRKIMQGATDAPARHVAPVRFGKRQGRRLQGLLHRGGLVRKEAPPPIEKPGRK